MSDRVPGITHRPACRLARQITEAFPWDTAPKYLIRDNDRAFDGAFPQLISRQVDFAFGAIDQRHVATNPE
jgi:hypothetical protein